MDPHFPLPGSIGIDYKQFSEEAPFIKKASEPQKTIASAFLEIEPEEIRKQVVIDRFLDEKFKEEIKEASQVKILSTLTHLQQTRYINRHYICTRYQWGTT